MAHFGKEHESGLKKEIVEDLQEFLDNHNALVQLFQSARNKHMDADILEFKVRLYNVIGTRQYELPTAETIGAIVFADSSATENEFDLIVEEHSRFPQRVSKLHSCYMSLQFPLLFVYGEDGYQKDMKLANVPGQSTKANKRMSMNMYYSYQIHDRLNHYSLLLRETKRYKEYLSGIYDAIVRGDRDGSDLGLRNVLTASFTGDLRYIIYGAFPQLTTADRADIVARIFEQKVRNYISFVRDSSTFGEVTAVLYTIEFQKRGLPHCHSLLWINAASKAHQDVDVDEYISSELPDPIMDADGYATISELMIHGPCGPLADAPSTSKKGCKSFIDIRKVNGTIYPTNKAACQAIGLLGGDEEWITAFEEADFGLPTPPEDMLCLLQNRLLMEETNYNQGLLLQEMNSLIPRLNEDQRLIFNEITSAIKCNVQKLIFVYEHGGTGKTFLWKAITTALRLEEKIVLTVAASGIAALLLPSGRTAHSRFQIPLNLKDECICNIRKNSQLADLLRQTDLIIWDEAPMNDRRCFEALDRSLSDILNGPNTLFGGKSIMLGGFTTYMLRQNMRLHHPEITEAEKIRTQDFSTWLLNIGDGTIGEPDETDNQDTFNVDIPSEFCIPDSDAVLTNLINFIYDKTLQTATPRDLQKKVIVCPKNESADMINAQVLSLVNHEQHVYLSSDEATPHGNDKGETELLYPSEYLNSLNFSGFPPHRLELKVGAPIMLLRNLNISGGLCNGTRLIVTQLLKKVIEARIITGTRMSEKVFLPRIPLINHDLQLPFIFKRKQFPVKLCCVMTINKSQAQQCLQDFAEVNQRADITGAPITVPFWKKAKPGNPNFTLDDVLKPVTEPLLALPSTEAISSPPAEILKQPSTYNQDTTTTEETTPYAKNDIQETAENPEGKSKTAKRGLFQEAQTQDKRPRQEN
nr:DNA helicase [Tanacetum cinerariifolium]